MYNRKQSMKIGCFFFDSFFFAAYFGNALIIIAKIERSLMKLFEISVK